MHERHFILKSFLFLFFLFSFAAAKGGNSSSNGGVIAGGVVAGVVVVVLLIVGVVYLVRRYQHLSTAGFANVLYSGADDTVHLS